MSIQSPSSPFFDGIAITELRSPQEGPTVSLESRLLEAFASSAVNSDQEVTSINRLMESADLTSPEALARLQEQMGQYNVDINLLNVLVRKAVGTAETLLRAS